MPSTHFSDDGLSDAVRDLLHIIERFQRETGRAPLVTEVISRAAVASTTTRARLNRLVETELVETTGEGRLQFVQLTEQGYAAHRTGRVPRPIALYPAGAHAGSRGVELESGVRWIRSLRDIFRIDRNNEADFYFLPIIGECMDGGRRPIPAGAIVLFRKCSRFQRPQNGRAVHVEVSLGETGETEALLRDYWYDEATGQVTLIPRNPDEPVKVLDDWDVDPRGYFVQMVVSDYEADCVMFKEACEATSYRLPMKLSGGMQ